MRRRQARGFTLIEVLVVLSLLAVLMGLSVGFIQAAGTGNLLVQTTTQFANLLSAARAQSFGAQTAYVKVQSDADGGVELRVFRNRQVFHWPCEDFEKASEEGFLKRAGGVEIQGAGQPGREGRYALFGKGGQVQLGSPVWLRFVDGFAIRCRIRPDAETGAGRSVLFKKGNAIEVALVGGAGGRLGLQAKILLEKDEKGEGGGQYDLRTGVRDAEEVTEWAAPFIPGRWHDVRIAYDRNTFTIHVNDRLRAVRSDRRNAMKPNDDPFVIGGGFAGGFDSLLVSGIFEDDEDLFVVPEAVTWLGEKKEPKLGSTEFIHFKNRTLDPRFHRKPLRFVFQLARSGDQKRGPRRIVAVGLSGESAVRRPGEE